MTSTDDDPGLPFDPPLPVCQRHSGLGAGQSGGPRTSPDDSGLIRVGPCLGPGAERPGPPFALAAWEEASSSTGSQTSSAT